ncbi:MAG: hypothetical protein J3K34DRAFT_479765 [Monoraphidium minutum]|nr:MAG: hypothetical protein J3K34DRAFT_479765 [Monoraphidium minutum]
MDAAVQALVAELRRGGGAHEDAVARFRRAALAAAPAEWAALSHADALLVVGELSGAARPHAFEAAAELLSPRGGAPAADAAAAAVAAAFATPAAAAAAAAALAAPGASESWQLARTALTVLALCLRPPPEADCASPRAPAGAAPSVAAAAAAAAADPQLRAARAAAVLATTGAVAALLRLGVGPPLCHHPELARGVTRDLLSSVEADCAAASAGPGAGGAGLLASLGRQLDGAAGGVVDLVRAAWDDGPPAPRVSGSSAASPSGSPPGGEHSLAGAGAGGAAAAAAAAAAREDWLLALAGAAAHRPAGAAALLAAPDVLSRALGALGGRGCGARRAARCLHVFEGLAERHGRELARVAGRRLTPALLALASPPPLPHHGAAGGGAPAAAGGIPSHGGGAAAEAELYELPRRSLALLAAVAQDEADAGAAALSLAAAPGAAAALVGAADAGVRGAVARAAGLARLPCAGGGGGGGGGAPLPRQQLLPLPPEVRTAMGLLELAGSQPGPAGERWVDAAVAAGAAPVLLRVLRVAGASPVGVAAAATACVLLKSPDADADSRRAGRRRAPDGAPAPGERALLQAAAWDVLATALAAGAGAAAAAAAPPPQPRAPAPPSPQPRGAGAAAPRHPPSPGGAPLAAPAARVAPPADVLPTPWAVAAVSRLLSDHPQAFFGFAAHPGGLAALVRAAAPGHGKAASAAARVLCLLATFVAAAGDAGLQQEWVMGMQQRPPREPAYRTARGALEFISENSSDPRERAAAGPALDLLARELEARGGPRRRHSDSGAAPGAKLRPPRGSCDGGGGGGGGGGAPQRPTTPPPTLAR